MNSRFSSNEMVMNAFKRKLLLESERIGYLLILSASVFIRNYLEDEIVNSLIGDNHLTDISSNYNLKADSKKYVPWVVCYDNRIMLLSSTKSIGLFNSSLDTPNTPENHENDFNLSKLQKSQILVFSSIESAEQYFKNNSEELAEQFKKRSRKDLAAYSIVKINDKNDGKTFSLEKTNPVAVKEQDVKPPEV